MRVCRRGEDHVTHAPATPPPTPATLKSANGHGDGAASRTRNLVHTRRPMGLLWNTAAKPQPQSVLNTRPTHERSHARTHARGHSTPLIRARALPPRDVSPPQRPPGGRLRAIATSRASVTQSVQTPKKKTSQAQCPRDRYNKQNSTRVRATVHSENNERFRLKKPMKKGPTATPPVPHASARSGSGGGAL
jgi:hypothetical protein